jgi:hypothetical protein
MAWRARSLSLEIRTDKGLQSILNYMGEMLNVLPTKLLYNDKIVNCWQSKIMVFLYAVLYTVLLSVFLIFGMEEHTACFVHTINSMLIILWLMIYCHNFLKKLDLKL